MQYLILHSKTNLNMKKNDILSDLYYFFSTFQLVYFIYCFFEQFSTLLYFTSDQESFLFTNMK